MMHNRKRLCSRLCVLLAFGIPGMLGVGSVQLGRQTLDDQAGQKKAPHVCIITHHEQHLGPTMPSCATVERDAKRWLADNNDDDAGRDATTAALMREAWTVRLAACGSLAAACTAGFSYILANAPARFSRLHRDGFPEGLTRDLRYRLAQLDNTCKRTGTTLPDASVDPSGDGNGGHVELPEKASTDREKRERLRRPVVGDPFYGNTGAGSPGDTLNEKSSAREDPWCTGSGSAWGNVSLDVPSPAIYSSAKGTRPKSWCTVALLRQAAALLPECDIVGHADPNLLVLSALNGFTPNHGAAADASLSPLLQSPHSSSALWSSSSSRLPYQISGDEPTKDVPASKASAPDASLVLLPRLAATAVHGPLRQWWCQPLNNAAAATGSQVSSSATSSSTSRASRASSASSSSSSSSSTTSSSDSAQRKRRLEQHHRRRKMRHLLAETNKNGASTSVKHALRSSSASTALTVLTRSDMAASSSASNIIVGDASALSGSDGAVAIRLPRASSSATLRTALSMSAFAFRRARSFSGCSTLGPPSNMASTLSNGNEGTGSSRSSSSSSRSNTLQAISAHGISSGSGDGRDRVAAARLHAYLDGKTMGNRLRVRRHTPRSQVQQQQQRQGPRPSLSLTTSTADSASSPGSALNPAPPTTASLSSLSADAVLRARERRSRSSHYSEAGAESSSGINIDSSSGSSIHDNNGKLVKAEDSTKAEGATGALVTEQTASIALSGGGGAATVGSSTLNNPETGASQTSAAPPVKTLPTPLSSPSQLVPPSHGESVRAWEASHKTSPPSHGDLVRAWLQQQEETAAAVAASAAAATESTRSGTAEGVKSSRDIVGGTTKTAGGKKGKKSMKKETDVMFEVDNNKADQAESATKAPPFSVLRAATTLVILVVLAFGLARCLGLIGDDLTRFGAGGEGRGYWRRQGLFLAPVYTSTLESRFRPVLDVLASARGRTTTSAPDQFLPDFMPDPWSASPSQSPRNRHASSSRSSGGSPQSSSSSFVVQGFGPTGGGIGRPAGKPPAPWE